MPLYCKTYLSARRSFGYNNRVDDEHHHRTAVDGIVFDIEIHLHFSVEMSALEGHSDIKTFYICTDDKNIIYHTAVDDGKH